MDDLILGALAAEHLQSGIGEDHPPAPPYRIIVTGSRHWPQRLGHFVRQVLTTHVFAAVTELRPVIIVHGDNLARGKDTICADRLADEWAKGHYLYTRGRWDDGTPMLDVEQHGAMWKRYGGLAGPKRNQVMVDLGADLCLAFPMPHSIGTKHCLTAAITAGIPVRAYPVAIAERWALTERAKQIAAAEARELPEW